MAKLSGKEKKSNIFFSREVFGMALTLFSLLSFLCLVTGDSVFYTIGEDVQKFFLGVFGYYAFPALIFALYEGVKLIIGFSTSGKPAVKVVLAVFSLVLLIGLIVQTAVTGAHITDGSNFGAYLSFCYNGGQSLSVSTIGGAALGLVVYPIGKLLSPVGAYIVYSLLAAIIIFTLFRNKIKNLFGRKTNSENAQKNSSDGFTSTGKENNASDFGAQPSSDIYTNGEKPPKLVFDDSPFELKSKRDLERGTDRTRKLNLLLSDGEGGNYGGNNGANYGGSGGANYGGRASSSSSYAQSDRKNENYSDGYANTLYGTSNASFEMRNPSDTIRNRDNGGYKVGERTAERTSERASGADSKSILSDGKSYAQSYDDDMAEKLDYIRKPHSLNADDLGQSPMKFDRAPQNTDSDFNPVKNEKIDLSEPERETYIINSGNKKSATPIGAFEERSGRTPSFVESDRQSGYDNGGFTNSESGVFLADGTQNNREPRGGIFEQQISSEQTPDEQVSPVFRGAEEIKKSRENSFINAAAEQNGAVKSADTSAEPSFRTSDSRGKQLSMDSLDEAHKLINPIDEMPVNLKFNFPPLDLLSDYTPDAREREENIREQKKRAEDILSVLATASIEARVENIVYGPAITRFELSIPPTISIKRVLEKQKDLNLWLAARGEIRIVAPIPGTTRIGIEVPNAAPATIGLKDLINSTEFKSAKKTSLSFCLGENLVGKPVVLDIAKMPHLLVAGATGTGKSVFLNTLLISLMYKYSPEELRIIIVDPKIVEFKLFYDSPHLMFNEIFSNTEKACAMLDWAVNEMERRYMALSDALVKNIDEYNDFMREKKQRKMSQILIIIDEFADLMASAKDKKLIEDKVGRLAQKARAAGIHLIMATQRPSVNIMEGSIKTNFTSRLAFKMASQTDAQVIMDEVGAEKLLGRGDVLFKMSWMFNAERAQGAFIDTPEIERVCSYIKQNNKCYYDEAALSIINRTEESAPNEETAAAAPTRDEIRTKNDEETIKEALRLAINTKNVSISMLQRRLGLGYPKAGKIVDALVAKGYISEPFDNKTRQVYITKEQFENLYGETP